LLGIILPIIFFQCIRSSGNSTKRSQSQEEKHLNRRLLDCLSRLRLVSGLHLKKSDCRMPHLPDILTPTHLTSPRRSIQLASFYLPLEHESRLTKFAFTFWLFTFAPIYHQMQQRKMEHRSCSQGV